MKRLLTIAGSDSGGGAGIQADLKTFMAFGTFGMSVITAVTAQNSVGVTGIEEMSLSIIEKQLEAVLSDIGADAVKTGMLANPEIVKLVSSYLLKYNISNLVVDPVMVAKSGDKLLSDEAIETVKTHLIPLATVITPNIPEAEALLNIKISSEKDMEQAAATLYKLGCSIVVIKGGHLSQDTHSIAVDVIYDGADYHYLKSPFIKTKNTHGTGCTFASAIAAGLAKGKNPVDAVKTAKEYITAAIESAPTLGKGHGPTNHLTGFSTKW